MEVELKNLFEVDDELVIESLASICRSYGVSEEDLFCKWESFSITHQLPSKIALNYITLLRQEYSSQIHNSKNIDSLLKRKSDDLVKRKQSDFQTPRKKKQFELLSSPPFGGSAFSPGEKAPRTPGTPSMQAKRFQDRLDKGKMELVFNEHIPVRYDLNTVSVGLVEGQQSNGYRYLYEKLTEKGDLLDERLNKFAKFAMENILQKENEDQKLDIASFYTHPNTLVQEPRYYSGQICCDSIDGRLNVHSCLLETSRLIGNGTRVQLDFNQILERGESLHLYPGQCIVFKGINNTGNCISVLEIIPLPDLTGSSVTGAQMKRMYPSEKTVSVIVASGPFTLPDSLNYEVLEELTAVVESNSPDAIILMGPFVNCKHPMIHTAGLYSTFKTQVADRLRRMKNQDELILEWLAFPQPPIGSATNEEAKLRKLEALGLFDENGVLITKMFPNPCQFYINELVFACSALDVAFDLSSSDIFVGNDRGDKPDAIYKQIIQSRHFYPLFPPAADAKLDSSRALSNELNAPCALQCLPDFLILPSKLKQNIKPYGECICINPGKIAKGHVGGTYCLITVHPMQTQGTKFTDLEMSDDDMLTSAVVDRSRYYSTKKDIITVFDAKPFDYKYMGALSGQLSELNYDIQYIPSRLLPETVSLAQNAKVVQTLKGYGTEMIAIRAAGYNNLDLQECDRLGISVARVPAYSPYAIAELAITLIMSLNRRIPQTYNRTKIGDFRLTNAMIGFDMHGKTVGVIGTGKIGKIFCNILSGFGCKVVAYDLWKDQDLMKNPDFKYVELDELYAISDIISLHSPLLPATEHLINKQAIQKMKKGVMIINTSRGGLIDTHDLIDGLKEGKVGYAGLDVYEGEGKYFFKNWSEQVINDDVLSRLLSFNNVIVTSHQAFYTHEALQNIFQTTIENIIEFAHGKRMDQLTNSVNFMNKK
ncbi:hypothetical protein HDV06_005905 [Boothiomyces sp. JEL0866]|nr:hypothetical protein HDV06_005905 [Boothiomyces sp. JEL0866]